MSVTNYHIFGRRPTWKKVRRLGGEWTNWEAADVAKGLRAAGFIEVVVRPDRQSGRMLRSRIMQIPGTNRWEMTVLAKDLEMLAEATSKRERQKCVPAGEATTR